MTMSIASAWPRRMSPWQICLHAVPRSLRRSLRLARCTPRWAHLDIWKVCAAAAVSSREDAASTDTIASFVTTNMTDASARIAARSATCGLGCTRLSPGNISAFRLHSRSRSHKLRSQRPQ